MFMKILIILCLLVSFNAYSSGGKRSPGGGGGSGGPVIADYVLGDRSCGQLDQKKCAITVKEYWDTAGFGCDRGLAKVFSWSQFKDYCRPGTRYYNRPIAYIAGSHKFQRELVRSEPITAMASVIPHNAMGYRKSGWHFMPNQDYSPTDLLNTGVRILSMDVHWFNGNFRAAHCTPDHLFCLPRERYWSSYLEEVKIWMDKNRSEIVIIMIEDWLDGDADSFAYVIEKIFGKNRVYSKSDLWNNNYKFPSMDDMRKMGKQIMFLMQNNSNHDLLHSQSGKFWPGWKGGYVKNFDGQECELQGRKISGETSEFLKKYSWVGFMEDQGRILGVDPGWIYDGTDSSGEVTIQSIRDGTKCGLTELEMDWVTDAKMAAAIWSWGTGEPRGWGTGRNCTYQKNGRWYADTCEKQKRFACRNIDKAYDWEVTNKTGIFIEGPRICREEFGNRTKVPGGPPIDPGRPPIDPGIGIGPPIDGINFPLGGTGMRLKSAASTEKGDDFMTGSQFYFALPLKGDQNNELFKAAGHNKEVWINFSTGIDWSKVEEELKEIDEDKYTVGRGNFHIRPQYSGKYLTEAQSYSIQYSWLGPNTKRQEWRLETDSNGYTVVSNDQSKLCLESFEDTKNGKIGLGPCHGGESQMWKVHNKGLNTFQFENKRSGNCMDFNGSKKHNWNSNINWTCYNIRQQYFSLIRQ